MTSRSYRDETKYILIGQDFSVHMPDEKLPFKSKSVQETSVYSLPDIVHRIDV